jgi:hypothetical protein
MNFREEEVGDWTNHMSNKMGEAMEKLVEEKFKESGLKF